MNNWRILTTPGILLPWFPAYYAINDLGLESPDFNNYARAYAWVTGWPNYSIDTGVRILIP